MKKRKVLFITNYPSPYRVDFFRELGGKDSLELTVLFLENPEEQKHRDASWFVNNYEGFSAVFLEKSLVIKNGLFVCTGIFEYLKKSYDEVIFGGFNYLTMMCAMIWMNMKKKKYSIEIDGAFVSDDNFVKKAVKRYFISHAKRYYCSGNVSDEYFLHYGGIEEKIAHYPFSSVREKDILCQPIAYGRKKDLRRNLGIQENKVGIFVGQIIDRKGIDILLKAATMLPSEIGIYIIGGQPREIDKAFISENRITNVHFLGFKNKEELAKYYCSADILIFPTREDIWGLVVNEALSYALPVITTDRCIAGLEMINPGETGIIIPTEDPNALSNAIIEILSWNLYEKGEKALQKAREYTIETMADRHERIILGEINV